MSDPTVVRDAIVGDEAAIERVARASWHATYRDILDEDSISGFLERNYSADSLRTALERAGAAPIGVFLVAERGDEVVGYLQFGEGGRGPELFRIYADPAHYGSGVGSALLAELHRRLAGKIDSYVLDVHSRNARGRAFYERNGFELIGSGTTPDCDLTMRKTLGSDGPQPPSASIV